MLVRAIAGVDHRHGRVVRGEARRALARMAQDDDVRVSPAHHADRVREGLPLHDAGAHHLRRCQHSAAEAQHGRLEGQAHARRRLVEEARRDEARAGVAKARGSAAKRSACSKSARMSVVRDVVDRDEVTDGGRRLAGCALGAPSPTEPGTVSFGELLVLMSDAADPTSGPRARQGRRLSAGGLASSTGALLASSAGRVSSRASAAPPARAPREPRASTARTASGGPPAPPRPRPPTRSSRAQRARMLRRYGARVPARDTRRSHPPARRRGPGRISRPRAPGGAPEADPGAGCPPPRRARGRGPPARRLGAQAHSSASIAACPSSVGISRRPAVSRTTSGRPSSSQAPAITSRVVPSTSLTRASSFPSKALKSVDFPALTGPVIATTVG